MTVKQQTALQQVIDMIIRITACMDTDSLHKRFVLELSSILADQEVFILRSQKQNGVCQCIAQGSVNKVEVFNFSQKVHADVDNIDAFVIKQKSETGFVLSRRCKVGFFIHVYSAGSASKPLLESIDSLLSIYLNQLSLLWNGMQDPLTGLFNRQAFDNKLGRLFTRQDKCIYRRRSDAIPQQSAVCFAFVDIDFFKKINDEHGHLYGDEVLIKLSALMRSFFRENDLLFRYGGEEFAIVLKEVDLPTADTILKRFLRELTQHDFGLAGQISVSIGFTEFRLDTSLRKIIAHADSALYYSKEHGRSQVNCYEYLRARRLSKNEKDYTLESQA